MSIFADELRSRIVEKSKSINCRVKEFRNSTKVFDSFFTGFPQKMLSFPQSLLAR